MHCGIRHWNQGRVVTMKQFIVLAGILLSGFMASVVAQDAPGGDVVSRARALAIQGQHAAALELLSQRLADNPEDSDARVLRGTVLSWDKNYDDARIELERVLAQHPGHADALEALINVELWSDHYDRVETLSDEALKKNPNNTTLLLSRAQALKGLHKDHEAALALEHLLAVDPSDAHAAHLLEGLHDGRRLWEVEAYPRIRPGTYGYVEAGLSPDATFYPHYRAGGEIYQNLTHGFEGSAGYRWLDFSTAVNIFTGSITKYQGNWMFTGRIYSTPDSAGTSNALQFLTRRYFGDGGNYLGVRYGWGSSVVETPSLLATQVLSSSNYYGEANWAIKRRWTMNIKGGAFFEDQVHQGNLRHYLCDTSLFFRF